MDIDGKQENKWYDFLPIFIITGSIVAFVILVLC